MCKAFYTHHRRCGCQILAYKKPCSAGPGSQHCHYHEYALINLVGSRCRYHEYHNWHPKVHKSLAPVPVESSSSAGPVPGLVRSASFEASSSSEDSPWVPGEPAIVKAEIVASLRAQGRLGASRASEDADEFSPDSSPRPGPRPGLRYGEGPRGSGPDPEAAYNADDESGNEADDDDDDDDEAIISLLQGLIIRRADDRREARRRALIGEELYTRRQNIIRQYQVLREEEEKLEGYKAEYAAACREEDELRRSEESRRALESAPPNYDLSLDRISEEIEEDEASPAYVTAKETNEHQFD